MRAFFCARLWEPGPHLLLPLAIWTIWLSIYALHKMVSSSKKFRQRCNSNLRPSIHHENSPTAFPILPIADSSDSFQWDKRPRYAIPAHEVYFDGTERRILDPQRYELSRRFLPDIISNLSNRRITIANEKMPNFVTIENVDADGTASLYAIFFEVRRDKGRKCRLVLRIQSAYLLDSGLTNRQTKGGKIAFRTLLRATYLGKRIRG